MTNIEWTDQTWNPIVGCTVTSKGCTNCYAMKMAARLEKMHAKTGNTPQYEGTTKKVNGKAVWTGKIGIAGDKIWEEPLRRKKPSRYFVNSMGDLFHPSVPDAAVDRAFAVMALAPQHTFQILTKHPERMRDWFESFDRDINFECGDWPEIDRIRRRVENDDDVHASQTHHDETGRLEDALYSDVWPLPNVWLGTSVEDQPSADARIPLLLDTPAAIRFISAEPLLGPVDLTEITTPDGSIWNSMDRHEAKHAAHEGDVSTILDWVIVGGESGPDARPMHPDWARTLRDQCAAADIAFFFKQWGEWLPWQTADAPFFQSQNGGYVDGHVAPWIDSDGDGLYEDPACKTWDVDYGDLEDDSDLVLLERTGKKAAGRTLDGQTHDAFPDTAAEGLS